MDESTSVDVEVNDEEEQSAGERHEQSVSCCRSSWRTSVSTARGCGSSGSTGSTRRTCWMP